MGYNGTMTLIVAIPTAEGLVLASDTQYTSGEVRSKGRKIYALNDHCAWAGAGELALIQRVHEQLEGIPTQHGLTELRDSLATIIQQSVKALLQVDVLTEFVQGDPASLLALHPGDFIFAEFTHAIPRLLHVAANGTPEWIEGLFASGNGAHFAYALLQKYQTLSLTMAQASLLAYKVIDEAIQVGAYGIDEPIDVWQITRKGLRPLSPEAVLVLAQVADMLRQGEIELLQGLDFKLPRSRAPRS